MSESIIEFKQARLTHIEMPDDFDAGYQVSIQASIMRILSTRLGERVMRPNFGSNLYLLRDRDFTSEWRILATQYIFEAIELNEPRVRFKQLHFNINATTGKHDFYLELDNR